MRKLLLLLFALALAGSAEAGVIPPPTPTVSTIGAWGGDVFGDSLAAGNEDSSNVTLETALQVRLGMPFQNFGIGGQTSTQIALRQSGVPILLSVSGNVLNPAGGSTSVTVINGHTLSGDGGMASPLTPEIRMLSSASSNNSTTIYGSFCGTHGYLIGRSTGGPPSTSITYFFQADLHLSLASTQGLCPAGSQFTPDTALLVNQPSIFWYGQNNLTGLAQIESDLAASVGTLVNPTYLVLGNLVQSGTSCASNCQVKTNNAALASIYGSHFLDVNQLFLNNYNASNPVDVLDQSNGVIPYTWRSVLQRGTLGAAISDTSTCAITLSTPTFGSDYTAGEVLNVDSEYILISAVSNNVVSACTRGYGTGGVAATHSNGAAITGTDSLHPSGAADDLIAQTIQNTPSLRMALLQGIQQSVLTSLATNWPHYTPRYVTGTYEFADLPKFDTGLTLGANQCLSVNSVTSLTNVTTFLCTTISASQVTLGSANTTNDCLLIGGVNPSCAGGIKQAASTSGLLYSQYGFADFSYAFSTPTTGSTVTIADTSDFAEIKPAGTLAALTVVLPTCSAAFDGKMAGFSTTQAITALTLSATAGSVAANAPTTLFAGDGRMFICRGTDTTWYPRNNAGAAPAATAQSSVASPTAPASTSAFKMQGLAGSITPSRSGTIEITISGTITSSTATAGDGIQYQVSYGTGGAPSNAGALTGTQVGTIQKYRNPATVTAADVDIPFSQTVVVTGLTLGTPYWLDEAAESIGTISSGALSNVSISAVEL